MKYEYLDHTADAKFRAYGQKLEETFANASLAMMNVMVDSSKIERKKTREIEASGNDLKSLLQNFLEQFLIVMDSENIFLVFVEEIKISFLKSEYSLKAKVSGDDVENYETIGPQVKAVTYNDMVVEENMVQVVVDV